MHDDPKERHDSSADNAVDKVTGIAKEAVDKIADIAKDAVDKITDIAKSERITDEPKARAEQDYGDAQEAVGDLHGDPGTGRREGTTLD